MSRKDSRWVLPLAIAILLVTWASAFPAIRIAVESYTAGALALVRFAVASVLIALVLAVRPAARPPRPRRGEWLPLILSGLFGIAIYHITLNIGEQTVTAGTASFLVNTTPLFTALLATAFLGERPGPRGWGGIAIGLGGATLVVVGGGESVRFEPASLYVLGTALSMAVYVAIQKPLLARHGALGATAWAIWTGTIWLSPFVPDAWEQIRTVPAEATVAALYLAVWPSAIGLVAWATILARVPASRAIQLLYVVPPIAVAMGWWWLGERPGWLGVVGGGVTIAGVALVNARRKAPPLTACPVERDRAEVRRAA